MSGWVGGLAEWIDGDTAYLSVAFTWKLPEARDRAIFHRACGLKVRAGGPGLFVLRHYLDDVAEVGGELPDAVVRHHPLATIASRGCPVGCWFCIVPKMEGREFTLLPDFPVRPILCDNNLSALPAAYQDHIVRRYRETGVPLLDANSGFEPQTFDEEVYARWKPINKGPWRFAYDEQKERGDVARVFRMLKTESPKRKRVYTLIGNEPMAACVERHVAPEPSIRPSRHVYERLVRPVEADVGATVQRVQCHVGLRVWFPAPRDHLAKTSPTTTGTSSGIACGQWTRRWTLG